MIGTVPKFYESPYLKMKPEDDDSTPREYLLPEASDADKKEYEEYYNTEYDTIEYKQQHPEMKHPYAQWNGEIVDKGETASDAVEAYRKRRQDRLDKKR